MGVHLMMIDLTQPLAEGERVEITLEFANGETLSFEAPVQPVQILQLIPFAPQGQWSVRSPGPVFPHSMCQLDYCMCQIAPGRAGSATAVRIQGETLHYGNVISLPTLEPFDALSLLRNS